MHHMSWTITLEGVHPSPGQTTADVLQLECSHFGYRHMAIDSTRGRGWLNLHSGH